MAAKKKVPPAVAPDALQAALATLEAAGYATKAPKAPKIERFEVKFKKGEPNLSGRCPLIDCGKASNVASSLAGYCTEHALESHKKRYDEFVAKIQAADSQAPVATITVPPALVAIWGTLTQAQRDAALANA